MSGLIGKKIGMTSIFDANGKICHVPLLKLDHALLPKSEPKKLTAMQPYSLVSMTRQKRVLQS